MKRMYCWRCKRDIQMLNEAEFTIVNDLYTLAVEAIKTERENWNADFRTALNTQKYRPVLEAYRDITGTNHEGHPSLLMHHRISLYGPICSACGKPLRTPKASYCVACGAARPTHY
jgi:hypothetical protein